MYLVTYIIYPKSNLFLVCLLFLLASTIITSHFTFYTLTQLHLFSSLLQRSVKLVPTIDAIPYLSYTYLRGAPQTELPRPLGAGKLEVRQISPSLTFTSTAQKSCQAMVLKATVRFTLPPRSHLSLISPQSTILSGNTITLSSLSQQTKSPSTTSLPIYSVATQTVISTSTPTSLASLRHSSNNSFSKIALAGILAAIAFLLLAVFVLGFMLRRHKRKAHWKRIEEATRSKASPKLCDLASNGIRVASNEDVMRCNEYGMGRIFVTREIESRNSILREQDGWEKHINLEINGGRL